MPSKSVTFITSFVLSITIWNVFRIFSTLLNWQFLIKVDGKPYYVLGTGILWSIIGLLLFSAIAYRIKHAQLFADLAGCIYFGWYWCDRLLVQLLPSPNSIFSLLFSSALLVIFLVMVNIPASKAFFLKEQ